MAIKKPAGHFCAGGLSLPTRFVSCERNTNDFSTYATPQRNMNVESGSAMQD